MQTDVEMERVICNSLSRVNRVQSTGDQVKFTFGVGNEFLNNEADGHDFVGEADGLAGHEGAEFDVALDDGAAESADPEFFNFHLGGFAIDLAGIEFFEQFDLEFAKFGGALVFEGADGDDGQARIELRGGDGIARLGAAEFLFKIRMSDTFVCHDEAGAELDAGGAHEEEVGHHFAGGDAAGDEDRHFGAEAEENLLPEDGAGDGADVAAGF